MVTKIVTRHSVIYKTVQVSVYDPHYEAPADNSSNNDQKNQGHPSGSSDQSGKPCTSDTNCNGNNDQSGNDDQPGKPCNSDTIRGDNRDLPCSAGYQWHKPGQLPAVYTGQDRDGNLVTFNDPESGTNPYITASSKVGSWERLAGNGNAVSVDRDVSRGIQ